jgi:cold-inducible RNA-binding protein
MAAKLFVGSLPYSTDDSELEEMFAKFGNVVSAKVIFDRETNRSRGFGFVEMETSEEAKEAISQLDGQDYNGRKLVVNEAKPKQ